jgi:class 3 adenylate cyclase/tetratricopeptide (TPR) repeat protein
MRATLRPFAPVRSYRTLPGFPPERANGSEPERTPNLAILSISIPYSPRVTVCTSCGRESEERFAFCPFCGSVLIAARSGREERKTVTVLFCDLTGSTRLGEALDPEALRSLLARYFERVKKIIERHGGTVEKFIGDAVMAVFGVPIAHEDDALRALRAAFEMRQIFPELAVTGRIGVATGEVVTGTQERLATGDALNVAARLEQAAAPGEVLLGEETLRLARGAISVEALEPLDLKGKRAPVPAFRLLEVYELPDPRHEAPFVGRERELEALNQAWVRVLEERRCELVTLLGEAGIGKSRLVAELLPTIEAEVVSGRCLPYGEGITYWPVVEVLKQLNTLPSDSVAASALRVLLGEKEQTVSAEEIAWGFRKLLEERAQIRPLVCLFDDVHWGEETFLDLLEHLALLSSGVPILVVCMARPDLSKRRPSWPVALRLEPLGEAAVAELIPETIPDALRVKIGLAASGNPLFLSEMLAMVGDVDGEIVVPSSLKALLAARLDQLSSSERRILQCAAVEGEIFHRGALLVLIPEERQLTPRLASLVRTELVRPDEAQLPGEDAFRFRHLLFRDAAYEALPKADRAELHERLASWLSQRGGAPVELDEILGYHLEQAARYKQELGEPEPTLAERAGEHLATAGRRALAREDQFAARNLLERAAFLVPDPATRAELLPQLAEALMRTGDLDAAKRAYEECVDFSLVHGDRRLEALARLGRAKAQALVDPVAEWEGAANEREYALGLLENSGDDWALALTLRDVAEDHFDRGRVAKGIETLKRALHHAEQSGDERRQARIRRRLVNVVVMGPTPVLEAAPYVAELEAWARTNANLGAEAWAMLGQGMLEALEGGFERARALTSTGMSLLQEMSPLQFATAAYFPFVVEMLAENPAEAEQAIRLGYELLERMGEKAYFSSHAALLAHALCAQGRIVDADDMSATAEALAAENDLSSQVLWRSARAKVLARTGAPRQAQTRAREAVEIAERTIHHFIRSSALMGLAEVQLIAGRRAEAAIAIKTALLLFETKGDTVSAGKARLALAEAGGVVER